MSDVYPAIQCLEGMEYRPSGPACHATCADPEAPDQCRQCGVPDIEGCFCPDGLLEKRGKCVPPAECGCRLPDGSYVEVYVTPFIYSILIDPIKCCFIMQCMHDGLYLYK